VRGERRARPLLAALAACLLCAAAAGAAEPKPDAGLRKVWRVDVDGDGKPEVFSYTLARAGEQYRATVTVRGPQGLLWSQRWVMTAADFGELLQEEGDLPAAEWVERFFAGGLTYGAKLEKRKLKAGDLDPELLDQAARKARLPAATVEKSILRERVNLVFLYRATWREDLVELVYVPELKRFIRYNRGPY
jgi:hypothetical protein